MTVVEKINDLLAQRNWTVYKLAQETELTDKSIYKWLRGESQPTVKALKDVCDAFRITMAEFFAEGNLIEVDDELLHLYREWKNLSPDEQSALRVLIANASK